MSFALIVKKSWASKKIIEVDTVMFGKREQPKAQYTGWFLLGIIPLYVVRY